jgi:ribosomal protein S18 acetylase RimI-like enzyme
VYHRRGRPNERARALEFRPIDLALQGLARFPEGFVHAWRGAQIVGELEMMPRDDPPGSGYVNHFYLVPEVRGGGLGGALHDYVTRVFRRRGARLIRLSASPTNHRANGYYEKHGRRLLGPRLGAEQVHLWELAL